VILGTSGGFRATTSPIGSDAIIGIGLALDIGRSVAREGPGLANLKK